MHIVKLQQHSTMANCDWGMGNEMKTLMFSDLTLSYCSIPKWQMGNGEWGMGNGEWWMVDGGWRMADGG
jgi:hypothetical protein